MKHSVAFRTSAPLLQKLPGYCICTSLSPPHNGPLITVTQVSQPTADLVESCTGTYF